MPELADLFPGFASEHIATTAGRIFARVGYRLALDDPGRLTRLALLDILPTYDHWKKMDRSFALRPFLRGEDA